MTKYAWAIAVAFTLALTTMSHAAVHKRASHFLYVRDFNYSLNPRGQVEGRFSPTVARACKIADKNKKVSAASSPIVARFRCPSGDGVNQFLVQR